MAGSLFEVTPRHIWEQEGLLKNRPSCPEVESSIFAYDLTTQALRWRYTATEAYPRAMGGGVVVLQVDGGRFVGVEVK